MEFYSARRYSTLKVSLVFSVLFCFQFASAQVAANIILEAKETHPSKNALPSYPGGIEQLRRKMYLHYPPAPCNRIKLLASLDINEDGKVTAAKLMRNGEQLYESEKQMENYLLKTGPWRPARYKGKRVAISSFKIALEDTDYICPQEEETIIAPY